MKTNNIAFSAKTGGKTRPVLIVFDNGKTVRFYKLTSKFKNKSKAIQAKYFAIKNWKQAGLNVPIWVNTIKTVIVLRDMIKFTSIGKLSISDSYCFVIFLLNS